MERSKHAWHYSMCCHGNGENTPFACMCVGKPLIFCTWAIVNVQSSKRTMDDSCSSLSNLNHLILYVCLSCMHACMHGKHTFTILYCLSSSTYSLPTISHIFLQCRISFPTKTKREKRRASMVKNLHWERVSSWEDLMRLRYSANIWILFLWYLGSHLR